MGKDLRMVFMLYNFARATAAFAAIFFTQGFTRAVHQVSHGSGQAYHYGYFLQVHFVKNGSTNLLNFSACANSE
jgi:hypothetical protein